MAEIEALPGNGFRVASTFAGCGGSGLGFHMAGFRTVWASEFLDEPADSHEANFSGVPVDRRDVREVTPDDVLTAIGLAEGELDVFEGSPPCTGFSTAGKRQDSWGHAREYGGKRQRVDDLFPEFARLVGGIKPKVFIAENVPGMAAGVAKGMFKEAVADLEAAGYRVEVRMLDAQWLGVPQVRKRLIFMGVREDLSIAPRWPKPLPYRYSVREVLNIERMVYEGGPSPTVEAHGIFGDSRDGDRKYHVEAMHYDPHGQFKPTVRADEPSQTITGSSSGNYELEVTSTHPPERRKLTIPELRILCGFPADFKLSGTYNRQWEQLGRAVPPPMMRAVAEQVQAILDKLRIS